MDELLLKNHLSKLYEKHPFIKDNGARNSMTDKVVAEEFYALGRIAAIDEFMKAMEEWDKRVGFIRDECAFFTISNIRDMAEQIKDK